MSPKVAFSAILLVAAGMAAAQSINFDFPDDGDRQVWVYQGLPTEPPGETVGVRALKSEVALPTSGQKPNAGVFVWDRKTGNLASKTLQDASKGTWTVKPSDFQDIAVVAVHVEHSGNPVAAATVDLDDGRRKVTQLITPSNIGVVTFFAVKPGSLKITVHFKVAGQDRKPVTQLLDASLTRSDPIPVATISLADAVDIASAPAVNPQQSAGSAPNTPVNGSTAKDGASKSSSKESGGVAGFLGALVMYLLALGGMGALIYYGVQYMKKNPDTVGSKLEQLGVQIPKPGDDPLTNPSQVAMPMPKAPAPVQKIILDDAAPDLIAPVAASTVVSDPKLVSQNGDAMPLPEGVLIVGREVGMGLSLVGESTVSRKHAQLTRTGGTVVVKDFGSTNGTFVNGIQVQGEKQLQVGDTVQFGSVRFRFEG